MCKLRKIEREIILLKKTLVPQVGRGVRMFQDIEDEQTERRIEILETKRQHILSRRESWLPKAIWTAIIPIIVSIVTAWLTSIWLH
jgi:hypothetical protein